MQQPSDEEIRKLNNLLRTLLINEPLEFFQDGQWFFYPQVTAYYSFNIDPNDPPGFSLEYFSTLNDGYDCALDTKGFLNAVWSGEDVSSHDPEYADTEWLGESYILAKTSLEAIIDKSKRSGHIYN